MSLYSLIQIEGIGGSGMIKKFVISCMIVFLFLLVNVGDAYTLQVIVDGQSITVEKREMEIVTLNILRNDCLGWKVEKGNVEIIDDVFVMPAENVIISAIIPTEYMLSTGISEIIIESDQPVGTTVTVQTTSTLDVDFSQWLSSGMILSNSEIKLLSFVMPYNDVTLNATYVTMPN